VTQFEYLTPHQPSGLLSLADAELIAVDLRGGSLAVLPTETGYMLAALATSEAAVERAFAAKRRPAAQVMHVACSSLAMAATAGRAGVRAARVLGGLTPGPVTVVVPKTQLLPDRLVSAGGTVGIRVPDHPATLQVISAVDAPLTASSLNISGSPSAPLGEFDLDELDWPADQAVFVVADDASIRYDVASTLVRISDESLEILRPGAIPEAEIRRVAGVAGSPDAPGPA
jgi:L-threonylcarbamoyladenylate synthase